MASTTNTSTNSYKYQWARYVARKRLEEDRAVLMNKLGDKLHLAQDATIEELATKVVESTALTSMGIKPPEPGKLHVGIVGAGVSGLFTGLIFDWLNEKVEGLQITYDILEAAGPERVGGRLYTHHFSDICGKNKHNYYDVGAMRFPDNAIMARTFRLFKFLGLEKDKEGGLLPYYLKDEKEVCPSYFNDKVIYGPPQGVDPFNINSGLPANDRIPRELIEQQPGTVVSTALHSLLKQLKDELNKRASTDPSASKGSKDPKNVDTEHVFEMLMAADAMSTRQYLRSKKIPELGVTGPGYGFNTIEWLETFTYGTGWYNQALAETVLEELDFEVEKPKQFWCVDGGTQTVASKMVEKLKTKPECRRQVMKIKAPTLDPSKPGTVSLTIKKTDQKGKDDLETREYFTVFNSTTLGALQRMDLTEAGFLYGTKVAIRSLGYGASCKVGMRFKTMWWAKTPYFIDKGGLSRTDLPLRVCVYPSYNINDIKEKGGENLPAVLLCSYTWAQDAQRLGALINPDSPKNEEELLEVLFHNLALLHSGDGKKTYEEMMKLLREEYLEHHAYDWYNDNNMSGAFAYFGPSQFSNMWPEIIKPQSNNRLYLIGEAASAHHAWIVGSLESAVRGVYSMLDQCRLADEEFEPYKKAMDLLKTKVDENGPNNLPFYPLPEEMPATASKDDDKENLSDFLKEGATLNFVASQAVLALVEAIVQSAEEEMVVPVRSS